MKKRKIGNLEVSAIGLGCMGFSHAYGQPTERTEAERLIRKAADLGYTFFDTAECYTGINADGSISYNEELVGKALSPIRDKVVIASKFGVRHMGDHLEMDSSPETIRRSIEGSLKRLGTDTIDLYYQHRIDPKVEPETVAEVMAELIKEGKIRYWGISETDEEYLRRADKVCKVTAIENRYSMLATRHEALFPVCEELNVGYVAFSPLGNGFLTGKYTSSDKFSEGDFRGFMPQYTEEGFTAAKEILDLMGQMSKEKNASMAQLSLAWMLAKKPYIVPIPGSRKEERLEENAGAADVKMSDSEIRKIDALLETLSIPVFGGHS